MERVTLNVEKREKSGKGNARFLRRSSIIPAIIYKGGASMPLQLSARELSQFISRTAGEQVIVNLKFSDDMKQAIVKGYQVDPVMGNLLHVDFQEISATETLKVHVHIAISGEAIGVKRDKGMLQHGIREIEIECLPDDIPGHVAVDVSSLLIGQTLHVSDLKLSDKIRILTDPDEMLATIINVKEEVAVATEVAAAVKAEPEVAKKGKKPEEEKK